MYMHTNAHMYGMHAANTTADFSRMPRKRKHPGKANGKAIAKAKEDSDEVHCEPRHVRHLWIIAPTATAAANTNHPPPRC